jgi:pantoate--beta-alanine ligase
MTPQSSTLPRVVSKPADLRVAVAAVRRDGQSIGLVPTLGALHAGHLSLVEAAHRECGFTVVSIFVNPTQFGPHEDYTRYPRPLARDLELLAAAGVDLVFAPEVETMYPPGCTTTVDVGPVAKPLEGHFRPGHFRGVATVVLKLLSLVAPNVAYFGRKDYQQSLVVRRMVADLDLPVELRICPTVREPDGLALSSRNAYLSPSARRKALALSRSLRRAQELAAAGRRDATEVLADMRRLFAEHADVQVDYLILADPETLADVSTIEPGTVALVAARVEGTRLIDNLVVL